MNAMGDRQDIDALLIGALYGELDSDDRARLDAHLASHPGDRAALDGLRSTRAAVRDSGVTAAFGAVEPAAAVSARLLQEAARRAPAPRLGEGILGFLTSLFRPIALHPALSATAALVLVIGIGSMMMKRGEWKVSQPPPQTASSAGSAAARNAEPATIAPPATDTPPGGFPVGLDNAVGEQQADDGLADGDDKLAAVRERKAAAENQAQAHLSKDVAVGGAKPAATRTAGKGQGSGYLEVDKRAAGSDLAMASPDSAESATEGGAAPPSMNRPTDDAPNAVSQSMSGQASSRGMVPAAPPPSIAPAPAPADPGAATITAKKEAENDAWARDQHARMVKLVNAGKCTEAGAIGADIARKAPEYYQSAVANDRAVRSCQAYVDRARRAKAPAPKSKAANQQPDRVDELEQAK